MVQPQNRLTFIFYGDAFDQSISSFAAGSVGGWMGGGEA
jgi:hypothetical protein